MRRVIAHLNTESDFNRQLFKLKFSWRPRYPQVIYHVNDLSHFISINNYWVILCSHCVMSHYIFKEIFIFHHESILTQRFSTEGEG